MLTSVAFIKNTQETMEENKSLPHDGYQLGTVEGKVRRVVESMGEDVEYHFASWAQVNVTLDHVTKPSIIYILPASGVLKFKRQQVLDRPQSIIAFVAPTDFDFEGAENDLVVESMKRLCVRFVKAVNDSGMFEPIEGDIPYQVPYDTMDDNVTGVIVTFQLREVDGMTYCDVLERRERK